MKMTLRTRDFAPEGYDGWHILTAAPWADAHRAELPAAVVSALPGWLACDHIYARTPHALRDFEDHLARFVDENRRTTRATRIVIDLHGAPRPLPFDYVKAIERAFRRGADDGPVEEVVIYTSLVH